MAVLAGVLMILRFVLGLALLGAVLATLGFVLRSGRAAPRWTDASPAAGSTPIRALHVTELRAAVLALE
jgi:hypothetical protein